MEILDLLRDLLGINESSREFYIAMGRQIGIFVVFVLLSLLIGRYTHNLVRFTVGRLAPKQFVHLYDELVAPLTGAFQVAGSLILIALSLNFLQDYRGLYEFLRFFMDLALVISLAWLASRLFRQFVRIYGIDLIRRFGGKVDELLLVFETIANFLIGLVAVVAFAQSQSINLVGLLASLGIGGLAVAFAAQKTLEQLLGTVVLYLDRPFTPGEYVRMWNWPAFPDGVLGRVESIGLRSTKLRVVAKGTLIIVPNSVMANLELVENVTRSKKVMVLLYLDFDRVLNTQEEALVEQVVQDSTDALFGIDPGSTRLAMFRPENKVGTRARVSFFILGSSEDSIELRKRLLELANETIAKKLEAYQLGFTTTEPTVYVDSPMTV